MSSRRISFSLLNSLRLSSVSFWFLDKELDFLGRRKSLSFLGQEVLGEFSERSDWIEGVGSTSEEGGDIEGFAEILGTERERGIEGLGIERLRNQKLSFILLSQLPGD